MTKTCHSGGAKGADTVFETICIEKNITVCAYSYKTSYHTSINKVEITEEDFLEGIEKIKLANKILKRKVSKHINLLARNWAQVKYSDEIFAISELVPSGKYHNGYINNSSYTVVAGGTGWAVAMGICENKPIYVFDQVELQWYTWSYILNEFKKINPPVITCDNFAGIGTREINTNGITAIQSLFNF